MARKLVLLGAVALVMFSTLACSFAGWGAARGNGSVTYETREIRGVDSVQLTGSGKLYIKFGEQEKLVIEAEENLLEHIESEVVNGELVIGPKAAIDLRPRREINYHLTVKELKGAKITGSGDIYAPALDADDLFISIYGSGDVEIEEVVGQRLDAVIAGSGDIVIEKGYVDTQDIRITGSGSYRAEEIESVEADVFIGGSGSARLQAEEYLNVRITGSGNVRYGGDPKIDTWVAGSGSVQRSGR